MTHALPDPDSCRPNASQVAFQAAARAAFRAAAGNESGDDGNGEDQVGIATKTRTKPKKPSQFKVLMLNDDYTPMEFVVDVLCSFFGMNVEKATQVMLKVHTEGKAVCGVFSKDVAETKAQQVNDYSRECEQPLLCNVEVDS